MKRLGTLNTLAIALITIGIGLYLTGIWLRSSSSAAQSQPAFTAQNSQPPRFSDPQTISGNPVHIDIDSLNIHNPVIKGVFDIHTGNWTLTTDKVQFAVTSYPPNNVEGMTYMYGHNRGEVFSRLPRIQPGATATVTTDNGKQFVYRYRESKVVKPKDVEVLNYTGSPILVLQTCTGFYYQNRQLFYFDFIEVRDA